MATSSRTPAKKATPRATAAKPAAPRKTAAAKKTADAAAESAATAATPVESAAARATATATALRDQVSARASSVRDDAQRKAGEIGEEVSRLYAQFSERALDAATQGKTIASGSLTTLSRAIDEKAGTVDDKFGAQFGDLARSTAASVANLAGALEEKDVEELVAATRDYVRKSPAVAIGGAALVGFLLARALSGNKSE